MHKNEAYAISGDSSKLAKQSLLPYMGSSPPTLLKQRAELRGRIRRWENLRICNNNRLVLICCDLMVMFRLGYSRPHIRLIWRGLIPPSPRLEIAENAIRLAMLT
eukprot:8592758-Pyramimonas_sp.AAC.1